MDAAVHFRSAVSLLGRFPALAGVDLDVERGEVVLLRGPNGAGKTTLLRACAGLVPVSSGVAIVLGCDLRVDPRGVRGQVGLLGHATGLYEDLTVADNVRFWARAARVPAPEADAVVERLGLAGRLARVPVARLSAGQRRRAALAVLVARRPALWLLDEPHASLDAEGRDLLDDLVRDAAAAGATVLVASHELDRAVLLADRVVTVVGGQIRAEAVGEGGPSDGPADAAPAVADPADDPTEPDPAEPGPNPATGATAPAALPEGALHVP